MQGKAACGSSGEFFKNTDSGVPPPPEILIQDVWGEEGEFWLFLAKMDLETTVINSVSEIPKP